MATALERNVQEHTPCASVGATAVDVVATPGGMVREMSYTPALISLSSTPHGFNCLITDIPVSSSN